MAADGDRAEGVVDFQTEPSRYRHWKLAVDGEVATLSLDVDEDGGLLPGYELKLNSYDLGVDIELADAIQRLRFEHPEVQRRGDRARPRTASSAPAPTSTCSRRLARPQGELLQVHQRDPQRHRGREPAFAARSSSAAVNGTARRRRLRAGARLRRDHAGRRRLLRGLAARGAAARRAARHRRPHPPRRQAQGAPRPRRRLLHDRRGHQGQARAVDWRLVDEVVPRSRSSRRRSPRASTSSRAGDRPGRGGEGHRADAARARRSTPTACATPHVDGRDRPRDRASRRSPCTAPTRRRRPTSTALDAEGAELLAAARRPRARRRDPAPALQRARDRPGPAQDARRRRRSPRRTTASRREPGPLARARDPPSLEARAEAPRPHLAHALRADRAGLVLRRHAAELALAADRSYMLVGRSRATTAGRDADARRRELRPLPDGATASRGSRRASSATPEAVERRDAPRSAARSSAEEAERSASSPSRPTTSTGTTSCASPSRSARASRPTRSPAWRRTCASPARRRWRPRSSAASPPGRTGSSSARTRSARRARSSCYGTGEKAAVRLQASLSCQHRAR